MADHDAKAIEQPKSGTESSSNSKKKELDETEKNKYKVRKYYSKDSIAYFSSDYVRKAAITKLDALRSEISQKENLSPEEAEETLIASILNQCVDGEFDIDNNNVIKEPINILIILEVLPLINVKNQLYLLSLLLSLLKKSVRNLQACTKVGLIEKLLKRIGQFPDEKVADKAIDLVGDLATYSITVRELKCFFAALQRTKQMQWPPHAFKLLEILKKMPEKHGPDVYFNFSGTSTGSITVPPIAKWPHQSGFTFVTWLQLDAAHLSVSEQNNRPHLYCFVNNRCFGYMAHFSGPMLVIEVLGKNGKKQTVLVKFKFEPLMWYHVCVAHTYNRFKTSEVKIFVNGQMMTSGDITIPINKEPMDKCFVGGSHLNNKLHSFKGQMAAIYLIAEPLSQSTVIALYRLGPGYKGKFKFRNELESNIAEADKKLIYDGKLSQNLLFTYNPKAVDGELCLESSPNENQVCFYHSPHALMMEGVQSVITHSLQAAMHSLGGIQMLFPLFTQLDCPLYEEEKPEPKICSLLLGLIYDLLRGSSVCQQQLIQSQGFMIIGHLLQKSSPLHLTEASVDILLGLARYFMATPSAAGLLGGLLDHILLEPSIWIKTPLSLQCNLLSLFATGYVGCLDYAGYIRKEVGVPRLILILRKYYSLSSVNQQSGQTSQEEIISLRAFVLLLVKQMIIKDEGIMEDELKSILVYLAVEENEENYKDVIQVILAVMCELPSAIIPLFDRMDGFHVFFKLLVADDEEIRIYSLKIICAYMQQLPIRRKLDLVEKYSFVSKVRQKLSIFDITMATYNALFEFLTARPTKLVSYNRHPAPDKSCIMYHPTVLPIIVSLLINGRERIGNDDEKAINSYADLTMIFLSDLVLLLNSNDDNKRLLLQLMCWQDWLFSLAYFDQSKSKDECKITDTVFSIIKMLLYYAIQQEKDGWRVWVDTLSILHAKVSSVLNSPQHTNFSPAKQPLITVPADQYIDNETGECLKVDDDDTKEVPKIVENKQSTNSSSPKSPNTTEKDFRRQFFEKLLLKESGSSVFQESLRRSRSANNILDENTELNDNTRPRSASPTFSYENSTSQPSYIPNDANIGDQVEIRNDSKSSNIEKTLNDKTNVNGIDSPDASRAQLSNDEGDSQPKSPEKPKTRPYVDIPEFTWSPTHQRLLTELLFSIEKDIQVWKSHTRKSVADFVSSRENGIYIMNLCHMVSVLSDSLIFCCGGLLPLLSSATSQDFTNDVLEACGGMTLDNGFSFLNRVLNIVDVIAFSSSNNFASVEIHRNISAGGVLRQCIRLVFCGAARNRVVCRQRERPPSGVGHIHPKSLKETKEAIKTLIASTKPPTEEDLVQNIPGHMTTITNPEKLLQDCDINRLRSLVYREVEDSRQSQYVSFVVIYFVAVLMVARYRDILDHDLDDKTPPDDSSGKKNPASTTNSKYSIEEKIETAFSSSALLLREILFDFSHYLSRVLVGSRGQDLISEGLGSLKSEDSTVELVMLLCSQEWQNALQRQAGTAFMDLVDEGRILSHSTRERVVITGSEARDIMNERENFENYKHATFETQCTRTMVAYISQYRTYDRFFKAKKKRNTTSATNLLEKIFDVLTSEFGAWPLHETQQEHYKYYKLDRWEDMQRRRSRFVKNPVGTSHLDATLRPGSAEIVSPDKPPPLKYHLFAQQLPSPHKESSSSQSDVECEDDDDELPTNLDDEKQQHQAGSIVFTVDCQVVAPGSVIPGTLAITPDSLYFTGDEDSDDLNKMDQQILNYNDCLNIKCSFVNIVAVMSRRYVLQNKAVEIFLANRRTFFFAFPSNDVVRKVVEHLPAVGIGANYGLPRTRTISLSTPRQLFKKSNMLQRWRNAEISNFEYLIFINTISGRTYNDLNQYFIFPWVLQNYDSNEIDLNDSRNYRDLSKPIGALNPFRLGNFVERFNSWDEDSDIPPFHFGTHYSTGGFVLNWMVRLEPFASLFLSLQGGKFDHPLRTFSSFKRAWENCQRDTSDVKELIPELFYLPEMLTNSSKFVFGEGEDGKCITDVVLPNWAKSPEMFIKLHREALESSYVSNNIHKWIDLIFGFKQKGKEAEHNANVFYHLTYEGSVNLDAVTDQVTKEALVQQIKSFGQTPPQLLTAAHPAKNIRQVSDEDQHKSIFLSFCVTPEVPVTHVAAFTSSKIASPAIITISCNQVFSLNKWINFGGDITSYQSLKHVQIEQDPSLETFQGRARRQLGEPLDESVTVTSSCFVVTSDNKYIFTCGYWDKSFKCFSTDAGKLHQCVFGHWDVVTCLGYSNDELTASNAIIVSGSSDATVLVWIWDHKTHRIIGPNDANGHGSTPIAICTGHELPITCVDVNSSVGIIASGSIEGACLLHSISGDLLYSLKGPSLCQHPRLINISNDGNVLVNYSDENGYMAMFSSNSKLLSHVRLTEQNLAAVFTNDGCFFIAGGFGRSFQIWRSFDLVLLSIFPQCDGSIRALALTQDQKCMVAGLSTGSIIAMAMDFTMWPRFHSPQTTVNSKNEVQTEKKDEINTANVKTETTDTEKRVSKEETSIIDKVPEDEIKQLSKSSSIVDPVPEDVVEIPTKTLLEKSLEMDATNDTSVSAPQDSASREVNVAYAAGSDDKDEINVADVAGSDDKDKLNVADVAGIDDKDKLNVADVAGSDDKDEISVADVAGSDDKDEINVADDAGSDDKDEISVADVAGSDDKDEINVADVAGSDDMIPSPKLVNEPINKQNNDDVITNEVNGDEDHINLE